MKKVSIITALVFVITLFSFETSEKASWTLDSAHSKLGFSITHLLVSDVEGSFKNVEATITASSDDFTNAVAEMTAEVNSINTDNEQRDNHLKNPDYFDAEKYPTITFRSTSFQKTKTAGTYLVKGDLTMHGITKPITLTAVARTGTNPMLQKTITGFKITGEINRKDFGIAVSTPGAMLGETVRVYANAEFILN